MRECLVQLSAKHHQLTRRRIIHVFRFDVSRNTDLADCLNNTVGVVDKVALVRCNISKIFQTGSLTVVTADECSENRRVSEVLIKVVQLTWVLLFLLVVVVVHPLEEDGLGHRVNIALAHRIVHVRLDRWYTWQCLEVLWCYTVEEVDSEHLVEHGNPGLAREIREDTFDRLLLHIFFLRVHLEEL